MAAKAWVSEIQFKNGTTVALSENDIVVIVGPNNAGKSVTLKELTSLILNPYDVQDRIIQAIKLSKSGTTSEVSSLVSEISVQEADQYIKGVGFAISRNTVEQEWPHENGLYNLFGVFVKNLDTKGRLVGADPPESISLTTEGAKHPIHDLQKNDLLEKEFSDYFRLAFGTDLMIHRNAGRIVPLYVGDRPELQQGEDRISASYLTRIANLSPLVQQGDGMRSFVSILLYAVIGSHSIFIADEPEAFLHPAQARLLGKILVQKLSMHKQLFLSTHNEDFLKGLLEVGANNLKIIRIERNGNGNVISQLDNADIQNLWSDSLLRHSNVLSGLFHSRVVICESDSDARFYSALLDAVYEKSGDTRPDILFIPCGGKHRIPVVVRALTKLNVSVRVVADFDVLNDINPLKEIFIGLNGDWAVIEKEWKVVKEAVDKKLPELNTEDFKKSVSNVLESLTTKVVPKEKIKEIEKMLKKTSAWSEAKSIGKSYIPKGDETKAFDKLNNELKAKGLHIVEIGELECFVPSIGNHGPKWISEVLTRNLQNDAELQTARDFIANVIS